MLSWVYFERVSLCSLDNNCLQTSIEKSGRYICPPIIEEDGSELANNEELAEQLMKLTIEIITEKTRSQSVDKGCPMIPY